MEVGFRVLIRGSTCLAVPAERPASAVPLGAASANFMLQTCTTVTTTGLLGAVVMRGGEGARAPKGSARDLAVLTHVEAEQSTKTAIGKQSRQQQWL